MLRRFTWRNHGFQHPISRMTAPYSTRPPASDAAPEALAEDEPSTETRSPDRALDSMQDALDEGNWLKDSDLPISPIMDEETWSQRSMSSLVTPKARERHWDNLTARERDLLRNPYASILSQPVRQDFYFHIRLPSFFLQRFEFVTSPTGRPWTLPSGIRPSPSSTRRQNIGIGRYTLARHDMIAYLGSGSKRHERMLAQLNFVKKEYPVWREDMQELVLRQMKARVQTELMGCVGCVVSANKVGGKWESKKVGCVLIWGKQDLVDERLARGKMVVNEKTVVVYDLCALLGISGAQALKDALKIEKSVHRSAVMISIKSVDAQLWLYKLASYVNSMER